MVEILFSIAVAFALHPCQECLDPGGRSSLQRGSPTPTSLPDCRPRPTESWVAVQRGPAAQQQFNRLRVAIWNIARAESQEAVRCWFQLRRSDRAPRRLSSAHVRTSENGCYLRSAHSHVSFFRPGNPARASASVISAIYKSTNLLSRTFAHFADYKQLVFIRAIRVTPTPRSLVRFCSDISRPFA